MEKRRLLWRGAAYLVTVAAFAACSSPVALRLRLAEGDKRIIEVTSSMATTLTVNGQQREEKHHETQRYTYGVVHADPSGAA